MKSYFHKIIQLKDAFQRLSIDKYRKSVIERIQISLIILLLCPFYYLIHIGCPIRFISGISCPGCGMTRAVLAALRLDFATAFYYHPLFILTPVMYLLFLFEAYFSPRFYKAAWVIIIVLFIFVYIMRLFIFHNDVVSINLDKGIVFRLLYYINK